ncbi:MAG TPA: hypothetical protein VFB58_15600 [Chloroflexota bacterium]|nr:hypothetical protein [Chloroflexota bacterium]
MISLPSYSSSRFLTNSSRLLLGLALVTLFLVVACAVSMVAAVGG